MGLTADEARFTIKLVIYGFISWFRLTRGDSTLEGAFKNLGQKIIRMLSDKFEFI